YYEVNYQKVNDLFRAFISKEDRDYLKINSKNTDDPILSDGALVITRDKIAERIVEIENFRLTYPYSNYIDEVNSIYMKYVVNFIYGNVNTPNYDNTNRYSEGSIAVFQDTINKYPESHFADILQNAINLLNANMNILNDDIKEKINNLII